jgi:hypothetical protein
MDTPQKSHHRLRRHCVTVFRTYYHFALVLGAAKEKAEGAFYLFLGCEFFNDFMEGFIVLESQYEGSSDVCFGIIQGFCLLLQLKLLASNIKDLENID